MKKFYMLLALLLACGSLVVVGCGDDDDDDSSDSNTPAQTTPGSEGGSDTAADDSDADAGSTDGSSSDVPDNKSEAVEAAKKSCEQSFSAIPGLSADAKTKISDKCKEVAQKAADGDTEGAKEATKTLCVTIADEVGGPAADTIKSSCATITK